MSWFEDPTGTAQKVTFALGAVGALVAAIVAYAKGAGSWDAVLAAVAPAIVTVLALVAMARAKQDAVAPPTAIALQERALVTGQVSLEVPARPPGGDGGA